VRNHDDDKMTEERTTLIVDEWKDGMVESHIADDIADAARNYLR
jgi:hypothetical protein